MELMSEMSFQSLILDQRKSKINSQEFVGQLMITMSGYFEQNNHKGNFKYH